MRARPADFAWVPLVLALSVPVFVHRCSHGGGAADPAPTPALSGIRALDSLLAEYEGEVVLLNFWATWCSPCVGELPVIARTAAAFEGDVRAIGVDTGDPVFSDFEAFASSHGPGFPLVWVDAGEAAVLAERFDLPQLIPVTILLDRSGAEADRFAGARDEEFFLSAVGAVLRDGPQPGGDDPVEASALHINVVGDPSDPATADLSAVALELAGPGGVDSFDPADSADLSAMEALFLPVMDHPYAQPCLGGACGRPVADGAALRQAVLDLSTE